MKIKRIEEKCTNCMLCVKDCISAVWRDINGVPEIVAPDDCNLCSHCLAVCPHDAIEHKGLDQIQIQKTKAAFINPEVYETIARGRRSIRQYKDKKIPDNLIGKVIHLANHAPKGGNFSNENCNISATNIMNYSYSLGLGTCYIGFLNLSLKYNKKLRSLINLPKGRMVYACVVVGYPEYKHSNTASRKKPSIQWI